MKTTTIVLSDQKTWPPPGVIVYFQGRTAKNVRQAYIYKKEWYENCSLNKRIKYVETGDLWKEIPMTKSLRIG